MNTFDVDPAHSSVVFGIKHMQVATFRASFAGVEGQLTASDSGVRLEGAVRVLSISIADPPEFREHVLDSDFFDAGNHPEIRFASELVDIDPDGVVRVIGDLTMRGVTRRITASGTYDAPVEDPFGGRRAALELRTTLDRRDWGLAWQSALPSGGDAVGWTVDVTAHLELLERQ